MQNEYQTNAQIAREWIFCGVLFVLMLLLGAYALKEGGKAIIAGVQYAEASRATAECEKWNDWELVYPEWDERTQTGYFITPWQKAQCDTYGIELRGHLVDYKNN